MSEHGDSRREAHQLIFSPCVHFVNFPAMNHIHTSSECPFPGKSQVIVCTMLQEVGPNLAFFLFTAIMHGEHPQRSRVRWILFHLCSICSKVICSSLNSPTRSLCHLDTAYEKRSVREGKNRPLPMQD